MAAALILCLSSLLPATAGSAAPPDDWAMYGHDAGGNRAAPDQAGPSRAAVRRGLAVAWRANVPGGPVYGTPAVVGGRVYGANIAGNVFALDEATGATAWLSHVGPVATFPVVVTSSVLVTDADVIVGDQNGTVWSLDRSTGLVRWVQRPNAYGAPAVWGSPTLVTARGTAGPRQLVLVPVASNDETYTATETQPCCYSRGSVAALDPETGAIVWQTYTITDSEAAAGAAGASIWSTPSYDAESNLVYVTTGNNYGNRAGTPTTGTSDAIIALDGADGHVVWKNQRTPNDTYVTAYPLSKDHPDADFGDSPKLFHLPSGRKVVAAGQKSGFFFVLDAASGSLVSQRQFLPGGGLGGFFADSAEANGVVVANGNDWTDYGGGETGGLAGTVKGQIVGSKPPKSGHVVAIGANDGRLREVWRFSVAGSPMLGAVGLANGVAYVHASKQGVLYALDARDGAVIASTQVGPAANGPSIAGGKIFLGLGDIFGFAASDPTRGGIVALRAAA